MGLVLSGDVAVVLLLQNAERLESRDLVGGIAGVAQHRLRMLTDRGRAARGDLGGAVEVEGARDGEAGAIGERHQRADLARLSIVRGFVDREHGAEGHAGRFEGRIRTPARLREGLGPVLELLATYKVTRLVLLNEAAGQRRVSGSFNLDQADSALDALLSSQKLRADAVLGHWLIVR